MKEMTPLYKTALTATAAAVLGVLALIVQSGSVLALPSETASDVPMVDGLVRTIAQTDDNIWVGGNFSEVQRRDGATVDDVMNVAVFDAATGQYKDVAPMLGGDGAEVWDMEVYDDDIVIAGDFDGPSSAQKNLVVVDGATGEVVQWYNSPALKSVLAAPALGRIYGGGVALSSYEFATGERLWTRSTTAVEENLRTNVVAPSYRDLELDGSTIWAACICDSVDGNRAKALVKLDTEGNHNSSWVAEAGARTFGLSLVNHGGALYLGAGGSDFLAEYSKAGGERVWMRDTSGSVQAMEATGGGLVVGGHFWEVADELHDGYNACGHRSGDNAVTLDPRDLCQTRKGLAAYSLDGALDPDWDPEVSGQYNLVWALQPVGPGAERLHVGGEFTKIEGKTHTFYARLSSPV